VIIELERQRAPVVVISHQVILQTILCIMSKTLSSGGIKLWKLNCVKLMKKTQLATKF